MFARLEHDIAPVLFPKEWSDELKQILLNVYGDKCLKDDKTFEVFGFSYPNEVLLIVSYLGLDPYDLPTTFFISSDLNNTTDSKKIMNNLFDAAGVFFDTYFATNENIDEIWDDYSLDFIESDFNGQKFYYKVSRENIALSMAADKLLEE